MATTVDTLLVRIEADMSDLRRSLKRVEGDVNKSTKNIGTSFNKLGVVLKGVIGLAVVSQFARAGMAAINLASDIGEMESKSKVVFGQFRDSVVAELDAFGDSVGRSTHELELMASTVQDTFVPLGFAREEAADLSVQLTKLAVDVASFNNASDTETMKAFQSALVGNHETVRRFGIVITEAELQQELFRMGIRKSKTEITASEKVQARLNLIIAGTSDAQGDALRTADSYANKTKALRSEFEELVNKIARDFLPTAVKLVDQMMEGIDATERFLQAIGMLAEFDDSQQQLKSLREEIVELEKALADDSISASIANAIFGTERKLEAVKRLADTIDNNIKNSQIGLAEAERFRRQAMNMASRGSSTPTMFEPSKDMLDVASEIGLLKQQIDIERRLIAATKSKNSEALKQAIFDQKSFELRKKLLINTEGLAQKEMDLIAATGNLADSEILLIASHTTLGMTLEELQEEYDKLGDKIEDIVPLQDELLSATQNLASGFSNALADMFVSGKFNLTNLMDVFKSFVKQMIAKAIELFFVNRILGSIFGLPTTTFGSGATVLGTVPTTRAAASGGAAYGRQPMMVGERGPELFVPHSAGSIMNSNNTRSAMGGSGGATVVQNINVTTGIQQTVRNEIRSMMPEIAANAKNAVADTKRRGGGFGRAFA